MNFIPKPNGTIEKTYGTWQVKPSMTVKLGSFDFACVKAFAERTRTCVESTESNADFTLICDSAMKQEEYSLSVKPEGVTVKASTESGVILALATLYIAIGSEGVPCFSLNEAPKFAYRGLMLDCARHFFSVGEIKKIIEQMSLVKLNKLHWHLTDDQGWRIEIKAYPELYDNIPHYTQDEIKDIVSFAKTRNVEVIPEIDLPGHSASAVHVFPWLSCAEKQVNRPSSGGIYKAILCAGKESTYEFVYKVLDEVSEIFESPKIHIGGDEAPKIEWMKCPACQKRLEETGSGSFEDLQGYFTSRVAEHLKSKGKSIICWNETLKSGKLPDGLIIQYWMPGINDEKAAEFLHSGGPIIFSDMFRLYLDYPHAMIPLKTVYEYTPAIKGEACGNAPNVLGLEACLWSERVETEEMLEYQLFPRVFALAENAWSKEKSYDDFERRLVKKLESLKELGIAYIPPEKFNPSAEEKKMVFQKMLAVLTSASGETDENKVKLTEIYDSAMIGEFLKGFGIQQ